MDNQLERVSVAQASKELNIDPLTLRYALRDGRLPIGFAQYRRRYTYVIYRSKLDAYKEGVVDGKQVVNGRNCINGNWYANHGQPSYYSRNINYYRWNFISYRSQENWKLD